MQTTKKQIAVIGAGPMGLMCAYELLKKGHDVSLFERDDRIGGMSASFDLGGTKIERYYHFICKTDYALFDLLKELNLDQHLVWEATRMGFYFEGTLYPWGDPISLLRFPKLSFLQKLRYGLHVLYSKSVKDWKKLDKVNAVTWLKKWLGKKTYAVLWHKLFEYKFYELQDQLSAAWIGSRIQRVGKSRESLFKEQLGYLKGGSDTLLSVMENKILALGGKIILKANVTQITAENNKVSGIKVDDEFIPFDHVVSTIPLPYLTKLVPAFSDARKKQIASIANVGVACVVLKLKHQFSHYFWMNVNHQGMEVPGIIEYSNLNPEAGNVVYVPYYMPATHAKYKYSDSDFLQEVYGYLKNINATFSEEWVLDAKVSRYGFAQTVCSPNFYEKLPPMKSEIEGFYMADTAYYYPEDRSISESLGVGKKLAELI